MTSEILMKAAVLETYGAPFRLAEVARPIAAEVQVLVRVKAASVSPIDVKIHAGQAAHARQTPPAILGVDLAGIVEAVGPRVTGFRRGDEVYGMTGGVGGVPGALAEFAAVDARLLALKPANLTLREAAALPLNLITAWEGLVDRATVHDGETVLVQGGAGGVGHIAVQLARAFGAKVFATASAANQDYLARLGATPIDYRETTVEQYVARHTGGRGFDIVYDTVGGATLDTSFLAVR
ncbi:MAG: zinc-binding dehydrogenase, partial [Alphaproteobacteria bacterium]|nr:zinc-binding dehydrogenase [Alphaproteobacteria bacterium]